MMNRAGYEVAISVTSIQAAMADFQSELLSGAGLLPPRSPLRRESAWN